MSEEQKQAALSAIPVPDCPTCRGNGMIGGPSYYAPGEDSVPCPDCWVPSAGKDARPAQNATVLRDLAQALAWQCFGECRGYSERLLSPREALEAARDVLGIPAAQATPQAQPSDTAGHALASLVAYLREEADFNRSWTDGRRSDLVPGEEYAKRRLELAQRADDWADAVERLSRYGAAPQYHDSTPGLHVGNSSFESWFSDYDPAGKGDKQRARDAYAAGMGDPLVVAAPQAREDAQPIPAFYVSDADVARLADHRLAGIGAMLNKEAGPGMTAYYAIPQQAGEDARQVGKLVVNGALHEWHPESAAFDMPSGTHPLYATPQPAAQAAPAAPLLAKDHQGMRVDYSGLLKQARGALMHGIKEPALAEMMRQLHDHLTELGRRWYAGDTAVVDDLLQLYCIECDTRAALSTQGASHE